MSYAVCVMTSGAIQNGVPTNVSLFLLVSVSWPATPKSASLTSPFSERRTLAAVREKNRKEFHSAIYFCLSQWEAFTTNNVRTMGISWWEGVWGKKERERRGGGGGDPLLRAVGYESDTKWMTSLVSVNATQIVTHYIGSYWSSVRVFVHTLPLCRKSVNLITTHTHTHTHMRAYL